MTILAAASIAALASGKVVTVAGYVLAKEGAAVPGAYLHTPDMVATSATDEDGYFEISIDKSQKLIIAEATGYNPVSYKIEEIEDIQVIVMIAATELEEVTVTADGIGSHRNRASTVSVESITAKALTRAACCNLSESFVNNPSVDVSYSDAVTGAKQIQLLGLAGTYVQTLTENFPNLRGMAAMYGLDYIPGPWMQSILVSKGAASVRNGFESVTGQINVEYKKPPVADPLLINLFASDAGRYEGNVVGALELNDRLSTALMLNYYNEEQSHDDNGDTFLDMPRMHSFSAMNRWHYQTPGFVSQSGVKVIVDSRRSGQTSHSMGDDAVMIDPYKISADATRVELFTKNGFILNADRNESVAIIASGSFHDQDSRYSSDEYLVDEWNFYAALLYESEFTAKHKLAAGINLNHDSYNQRGNVVAALTPQWRDARETSTGAYAEYTFTPVENFTLMVGIRADYSTIYRWFATPRLHIKYDASSWASFRASVGRGYRTTFVLPDVSYLLASSRQWNVATDLDQESAWNYGISSSFYIPIAGRNFELNAEWFYTDFQSQVVVDLDSDAHQVNVYNLDGTSTSSVLQVDATYEFFRGFTLMCAYRWMDVKCTYGGEKLRKPLTGRYKALATASYETALSKWQFDLTAQFNGGGRMPTPDAENPLWESSFNSFAQLSAQITRRFKHWSIYVGGENLTNYKQKNPIIAGDDPYGTDFDATMVWGPTMGRKLYVGIRYYIPK